MIVLQLLGAAVLLLWGCGLYMMGLQQHGAERFGIHVLALGAVMLGLWIGGL